MGKPPDPGLRPKEKKKIQRTYKNHKKRRAAMMVMYPQKDQWIERRVNSGSPIDDRSHNDLPISELIKLEKNSKPLDPVKCKGGNGNKMMDDYEEERKLPTQKHSGAEMINWAESTTSQVSVDVEASQIQKNKCKLVAQPTHHILGTTKFQGVSCLITFSLLIHPKRKESDKSAACVAREISLHILSLIKIVRQFSEIYVLSSMHMCGQST